jgi:hypothetical protein
VTPPEIEAREGARRDDEERMRPYGLSKVVGQRLLDCGNAYHRDSAAEN